MGRKSIFTAPATSDAVIGVNGKREAVSSVVLGHLGDDACRWQVKALAGSEATLVDVDSWDSHGTLLAVLHRCPDGPGTGHCPDSGDQPGGREGAPSASQASVVSDSSTT